MVRHLRAIDGAQHHGDAHQHRHGSVRLCVGGRLLSRAASRQQERDDGAGNTEPGLLENVPYEADASFGPTSAYTPLVVTDLYDEHIVSKLTPGAAAQGGTKFKYMRTTLTARGRAQLATGDVTDPAAADHNRERNEAAADMRAYVISGPFITGTQ
jgi:hypothetical protein